MRPTKNPLVCLARPHLLWPLPRTNYEPTEIGKTEPHYIPRLFMRCKPVVWASSRCTQQSQHHHHQPQQLGSFSNEPWNKRRGLSWIEEEWDQIRSSQCAGRDFFLSALWRLAPFLPFVSRFLCGRPLWFGRIFWVFALMGGENCGSDVRKWNGWRWGVGKVGVRKL